MNMVFESPVPLYILQKRYIGYIQQAVEQGKILIIEAGSGFGKTIANLFSIFNSNLENNFQLIYLSKTHKQSNQVIKEPKRINDKNSTQFLILRVDYFCR